MHITKKIIHAHRLAQVSQFVVILAVFKVPAPTALFDLYIDAVYFFSSLGGLSCRLVKSGGEKLPAFKHNAQTEWHNIKD